MTLTHFPLPKEIVAAGKTTVVATWKNNGVNRAVVLKRAELLYRKAQVSIGLTEGATAAWYELTMLMLD